MLPFETAQANRLYGYAQGALAAGGIAGGISAGALGKRLRVSKAGNLLIMGAVCVFPIGSALLWLNSGVAVYMTITSCCFVIMVISTIFTVQIMSFMQAETPQNLVGKVIAVAMTGSMCAQPFGNALYGFLFELLAGYEAVVVLFAGVVSLTIAVRAKRVFSKLE